MTEPTPETPKAGKAAKSDKRKQTIIAVSAVLGVLLTYVLIRRSQSNTTTANTTGGVSGLNTAADAATAGADATQTSLANLSNQIGSLVSQLQTSQSGVTTADPYTLPSSFTSFFIGNPNGGASGIYGTLPGGGVQNISPTEWDALSSQGAQISGNYTTTPPPSTANAQAVSQQVASGATPQVTTPLHDNQTVP